MSWWDSVSSGPYAAVVNVFSSFGYFEHRHDDLAALHAWFQVLRPGGVLVMELMRRDRVAFAFQAEAPMNQGPVRETGVTELKALVSEPCSTGTGAEIAPSTAGSSGIGPWCSTNCWEKLSRFGA